MRRKVGSVFRLSTGNWWNPENSCWYLWVSTPSTATSGTGGWGMGGGRGARAEQKGVCVCVWVGGYGFCLIRASHNAVLPCSPRATLNACGTTGFRRTGAQDLCRGGHGSPAVIRESEHGACGNGNGNEASWRSIPGSTSYAGASTHVSVAPLRSAARTRGCRGGHGEQ